MSLPELWIDVSANRSSSFSTVNYYSFIFWPVHTKQQTHILGFAITSRWTPVKAETQAVLSLSTYNLLWLYALYAPGPVNNKLFQIFLKGIAEGHLVIVIRTTGSAQ